MPRTADPSAEVRAEQDLSSLILVIGVGGAGCNAVSNMWEAGVEGVSYLACNTDRKSLDTCPVNHKIRLGDDGLGAGNRPERGRDAAIASLEAIRAHMKTSGCRMVFITAGMGGGTGTGAAPVIAKLSREMGMLTVGVVSSPLLSEGRRRWEQATRSIAQMEEHVDALLVIDNNHVIDLYEDLPLRESFSRADDVLSTATRGIADIVTQESDLVGVDFSDVAEVLRDCGRAHMSVTSARGADRAAEALRASLESPLMEHNRITGAKNILLNFTTTDSDDLKTREVRQVLERIQQYANQGRECRGLSDTNIIWGTSLNPSLEPGTLELVVIATGFSVEETPEPTVPEPEAPRAEEPAEEEERQQAPERSAGTPGQEYVDDGQETDADTAPASRTKIWETLAQRITGLFEGEDTPMK